MTSLRPFSFDQPIPALPNPHIARAVFRGKEIELSNHHGLPACLELIRAVIQRLQMDLSPEMFLQELKNASDPLLHSIPIATSSDDFRSPFQLKDGLFLEGKKSKKQKCTPYWCFFFIEWLLRLNHVTPTDLIIYFLYDPTLADKQSSILKKVEKNRPIFQQSELQEIDKITSVIPFVYSKDELLTCKIKIDALFRKAKLRKSFEEIHNRYLEKLHFLQSIPELPPQPILLISPPQGDGRFSLSQEIPNLSTILPIAITFQDKTYSVDNWINLVSTFGNLACANGLAFCLRDYNLNTIATFSRRNAISSTPQKMQIPRRIPQTKLWFEAALPPNKLVGIVKWMAWRCNLPLDEITVEYTKGGKEVTTGENASMPNQKNKTENLQAGKDTTKQLPPPLSQTATANSFSIVRKTIAFSDLTSGITIPVAAVNALLPHLPWSLHRGEHHTVSIFFNETEYQGRLGNVAFSDSQRARVIQLRFQKPLIHAISASFPAFHRDNRNTLPSGTTTLTAIPEQARFFLSFATGVSSIQVAPTVPVVPVVPDIPEEFLKECECILKEEFPSGFLCGSIIAVNKFRRKYESIFGESLSEAKACWLESACRTVGIAVDRTIFPIQQEARKLAGEKIEELLINGARVIYYEPFFARHQDAFTASGIGSAQILAAVLRKIHPEFLYQEDCLRISSTDSDEAEIVRILQAVGTSLSLEELAERLPGIPPERLQQACRASEALVRNADDILLLDQVLFNEDEARRAVQRVEDEVEQTGYALLLEVQLEATLALYSDLQPTALRLAFFRRFLSPHYDCPNGVITPKGTRLDASTILDAFCRNHPHFTLTEIEALAQSIRANGQQQALAVARRTALQLDAEHFVQPSLVDFDPADIDRALAAAIRAPAISLAEFHSFSLLPTISGYTWSPWLLASYCRHLSRDFTLLEHSISRECSGIIARKDAGFRDFWHAAATLAIRDHIPVDGTEAEHYAIRTGLLLQRRASAVEKLLAAMTRLAREE